MVLRVASQTQDPSRARDPARVLLIWVIVLIAVMLVTRSSIVREQATQAADVDKRLGIETIGQLIATIQAADDFRADRAAGRDASQNRAHVGKLLVTLRLDDEALPSGLALGPALDDIAVDWGIVSHESDANEARFSTWITEVADAASSVSDRSGLSFDSDSDERDLGDAYAVRFLRSSDLFARLADIGSSIGRRERRASVEVLTARVDVAALAASRVATSDVDHAAQHAPAIISGLARDAARTELTVEAYAETISEVNDGMTPHHDVAMHRAGQLIVAQERRLDSRVGALLDGMLTNDERRSRDREVAILLAASAVALLCMLLVKVIATTLRNAKTLERLAAERARERAVSAVQGDLLEAERLFRVTFEHAPIGILIVDATLRVVSANGEFTALLLDVNTVVDEERALFERVLATGETRRMERRYRRNGDTALVADVALRRFVLGDQTKRYVIATFRDVSERTALAKKLAHDAKHDALTELPNRGAFEEALRSVSDGRRTSLLYLDLDGFKLINDTHGHHAGDRLLAVTAQRLSTIVRAQDFAGRIGGDEFAVLLEDADAKLLQSVANRVIAELREPFAYENRLLSVSVSVGAVMAYDVDGDAEQTLRDADSAMYYAKALGGNRCVVFDSSMREASRRRVDLIDDLRRALSRDEIAVAYQPIFDLRSERLIGYEALARWQHPTKGSIAPSEFIPIAEDVGLIESLGRHVLLEACRQLSLWRAEDPAATNLTMNMNVAAQQILSGSIIADLRDAVDSTGLPARYVTLEITESTLLDNTEQTNATLAALRAMGARICIDDFGTGYSSLLYLQRFPIDEIKVDRSFVSSGGSDALVSRPIVEMLTTLARVLDLSLVVEGIETREQLGELLALGCERGQGYLLSKPVPATLAAPARLRSASVQGAQLATIGG